jgi:uncharacterized cupredoxin-like copper-binding protein
MGMMGTLHRRAGIVAGALASLAVLLASGGCGDGGSAVAGAGAGATIIRISEHDFRITAPSVVRSGDIRLQVRNEGPDIHELIVVHAPSGGLPMRGDGLTVDERALRRVTVGSLEPGSPGSVRELRLHLAPGRYEIFCNMAGHYMGGMHAVLTVS